MPLVGRRPVELRCQDPGVLGAFVLVIVVLLCALVALRLATFSITTAIAIVVVGMLLTAQCLR